MVLTKRLLGGIAIAWKLTLGEVDFLHSNRQLAVGIVTPHESAWMLGIVYARTYGREHRQLWDQLCLLKPWVFLWCQLDILIIFYMLKADKVVGLSMWVKRFRSFTL